MAYETVAFVASGSPRAQEALKLLRKRYGGVDPDEAEAVYNLGNTLQELGQVENSIARYDQALTIHPDCAAAHHNLGGALQELGREEEAIGRYEQALAIRPDFAEAHNNLGITLQELGRQEQAISCYEQALAIRPDYAEAYYNMGYSLQELGQVENAISRFEQALSIQPELAEAHNNLGNALQELGREEEAIARYEQALAIKPDYVDAYYNLGEVYEKLNQLEKATFYVKKVFQLQADEPKSNRLAAVLLKREGKYKEALEILRAISLINIDTKTARSIHFELGKLYDLVKDSDSAIHHFKEGNQLHAECYESTRFDKNIYLNEIKNISKQFTQEWVQSWPQLTLDSDIDPIVFLVGFPRSGTTLLDQILDSHPRIQVIEESPMITKIIEKINVLPGSYPTALASLNKTDVDKLRKEYLIHAKEYIDKQSNTIIIDKFPLHTIHIGLIYKLFPKSKIILALRHPCDVCLSNFMQHYGLNDAMANYFTLEDTAELYHSVMGLWQEYVKLFPLSYLEVKYELLVDDFETETRKLCNFLEIDWDPLLLDYTKHAKDRGKINTPSYSNVTLEIYHTAKYRWQRYKEHLMPIMNKLEQHITYFGY